MSIDRYRRGDRSAWLFGIDQRGKITALGAINDPGQHRSFKDAKAALVDRLHNIRNENDVHTHQLRQITSPIPTTTNLR